jgi:cytokinesis protein
VNNTTLLHFLERTIAKHFPEMEVFLDELAAPAEAYRGVLPDFLDILNRAYCLILVNLQDVRKGLSDLREGMTRIRQELTEHFADVEQSETLYGKQMWAFLRKASNQLEDLVDDVNSADTTFTEVVRYYGEEDRNMSSSEFYAIFKTFVTSYKVRLHESMRNCTHLVIEMQVRESDSC